MIEFTQIGWFDPASKRFCYDDEKVAFAPRNDDYTHPVFSIDPDTAKLLSVNIGAQDKFNNEKMPCCRAAKYIIDNYKILHQACPICNRLL